MFTVYVLIIFTNSTIVYLMWLHQNLHEPMYIFIAALLINSVLFSTAIYPKLLVDFLSEEQIISYSACLFQFHIFYSLGGSEFLLLSAMAYDRYVSICKPLQYPTIMRRTTVIPTILSAETTLCHFTLKAIFCNNAICSLECVRSRIITIYGVFALLDLIILPMLFIIFTDTKILIISTREEKSCRDMFNPGFNQYLSILSAYDVSIARVKSNFPKTARLIMMLQIVLYHPLFNPLIYGLKMKEISKPLKRLFCPAKTI